jgi:pyridoxal phosphate enzyme (YggS family)
MFHISAYQEVRAAAVNAGARLVVVSKDQSVVDIQAAYDAGQRIFGESYFQELLEKKEQLPADIEWHMIGHVQRNKVRALLPHVSLIHSVDSYRLLKEIDTWAKEIDTPMDVLLQLHITDESTKYGFEYDDLPLMLRTDNFKRLEYVRVRGIMGMAAYGATLEVVRAQFKGLKTYADQLRALYFSQSTNFTEVSMGMSDDYHIALEEGATIIRVGSSLFTE